MLQILLNDRYFLLSMLNIFVVHFFIIVGKIGFPNHMIVFYFLGLISFTIVSYFMFKEVDYDDPPGVPLALLKFIQMVIPVTTLMSEGFLLFF